MFGVAYKWMIIISCLSHDCDVRCFAEGMLPFFFTEIYLGVIYRWMTSDSFYLMVMDLDTFIYWFIYYCMSGHIVIGDVRVYKKLCSLKIP